MAKRRGVVLGLGALATGSGAVFASGAFDTDTTSPTATLQVLSDGNIVVEGDDSADNVDSATDTTLFDETGELEDEDIDRGELPLATVNDEVNADLEIEVLVELRENGEFDPILNVTNGDPDDVNIEIRYEDSGGDDLYGDTVGDDNDLEAGDVQTIFQFEDEDGNRISPAPDYSDDVDNTGENTVTISSGETEEISLNINTDFNSGDSGGSGGDITGIINSIAGNGDRGFGEDENNGSVELLNGILVHADSASE